MDHITAEHFLVDLEHYKLIPLEIRDNVPDLKFQNYPAEQQRFAAEGYKCYYR